MIRPATSADVPAILELIRALAVYEKLLDQFVITEAQLREHLFGPRPYAEVVVAEEGTQLVGYALFFHTYSTFLGRPSLYLEDLFVLPELRGKGHGKALLARLAQIAVERNCGRFEWMVLDWNTPSIQFYESLGAAVLPEWKLCRMTGDALRQFAATAK